jgi:predicted histone-like DNA-binding protein
MAVQFKMVPKKNMQTSPPEVKYFPCAVSQGKVDLDTLADIVASQSTMSKADCYGVIVGLTHAIAMSLADGKIVAIDFLGSLKLTLQGTPADSDADLGKANISKINVVYKPSKELKEKLKKTTFKRIR